MNQTIKMVSRFKTDKLTAHQYINLSQSLLLNLKKFHSIFEKTNSWGDKPSSWTEINSDFSNFEKVVLDHIYDKEIVYTDITGNKIEYSLEATSWAKFSNSYSNLKKPLEEKYLVSIGAGGETNIGFINIELPSRYFSEFSSIERLIDLISNIQRTVDLHSAYVYTNCLYDHVVDYENDYDTEIGWLNFFKNKEVLTHIPKQTSHMDTANGIFFWLEDSISEPTNETIASAIDIRNSLGGRDYLFLK
jgi:hypothetical protein